ncbi:uncharacterized protein A1O9_07786 [Exophiala aquamarina CBS 119918]|uniref:Uncharacterized protein n=1 Tax=Exophiala aquamarina CBS 119918 TaxID=1182545 RepID=A0A072PL21_9EURO|nr:uncharacterized protein A1O9_07786 [Exophiala aquamarina CBS 119918]KEF56205.1 hypothetical protein A1O9_07786 [Exophiala aquamarina CBS 119918]
MAQKCVHKGCGKVFNDPEEECIYHPGPPEFHEGQKGWKCCKPRVLTFDEFLAIPPCTTGRHSTVDDTPAPPPKPAPEDVPNSSAAPVYAPLPVTKPLASSLSAAQQPTPSSTPKPEPPPDESDDPDAEIPNGSSCKRRGCGKSQDAKISRDNEECIYHPGIPIFHEGSKGWTCCKRRVLEFDEFMKIEGCKKRKRHCYIGKKKPIGEGADTGSKAEEKLETVRNDFYQTPTTVIVSFYLKKIDKGQTKIEFSHDGATIALDLPTSDGKRFTSTLPLFAPIDPEKSSFKIMGTKLEMTLVKKDGASWSTLRNDEQPTGSRIQLGQAGRAS